MVSASGMKKAARIALSALLYTVLGLSLLIILLSAIFRVSGDGKKSTWFFGYGFYQIVSGSMRPELEVGDVVIAKKVENVSHLGVGDNIVFLYSGRIVTHKIVEINGNRIVTKGKANTVTETVPFSDVIARQTAVLPGLGKFLDFIRGPWGFVLLIVLPLGGIIIYNCVGLSKRLKQYRLEKAQEGVENERMRGEIESLKARLNSEENSKTDTSETACSLPEKPENAEKDYSKEDEPQ